LGQSLTLAYHQGDVLRHSVHIVADGNLDQYVLSLPTNIDLSGSETVTVLSVDAAGTVHVSIDFANLVMSSDPNWTGPTANTQEVAFSMDGRILSVSALDEAKGFGLVYTGWTVRAMPNGAWLTDIASVLPSTPVKAGDTWTRNFEEPTPPSPSGALHIAAAGKYLRDESFQGVNSAVVETTSTTSVDATEDVTKIPPGTVNSTGYSFIKYKETTSAVITAWIDPRAHRILKSHMTSTTDITMTFLDASGAAMTGVAGPMSIRDTEAVDLLP
jgi:hypothetical protein